MASLLKFSERPRWQGAPHQLRLDNSNPVARRCALAVLNDGPFGIEFARYTTYAAPYSITRDAVPINLSGSAGFTTAASKYGAAFAGGSGRYQTARYAGRALGRAAGGTDGSFQHSLVFVGSFGSGASWISDGQSHGNADVGTLYRDSGGNLVFFAGNGANYFTGGSAVALPTSECVLIITSGDQTIYPVAYLNGVKTTAASRSDAWPSPHYQTIYGSSAYPTANYFNGVGKLFAVISGLLNDAQAASLTADPFQLFERRAPILFFTSGGAAATTSFPFRRAFPRAILTR